MIQALPDTGPIRLIFQDAGIEAAKLGHGGIEHISELFGLDPKTVRRGLLELEGADAADPGRVRKKAGQEGGD